MCGRYTIAAPAEAIRRMFATRNPLPNLPARYNVAPTQDVAVVRPEGGERWLVMMRWGLVPAWSKAISPSAPLINARGESVADKPSFRQAYRLRRCLVPTDGFYEWKVVAKGPKQPVHIRLKAGGLFAMAGLWESWRSPEGKDVESMAIVTTSANDTLKSIHDRMPVIVGPNDFDAWLDVERFGPRDVARLIAPAPDDLLAVVPVSTRVNVVGNDDEGLLAPIVLPQVAVPETTQAKAGKPGPKRGGGQLDLF